MKGEIKMSKVKVTQDRINSIMAGTTFSVRTEFDKCTVVTAQLPNGFIITEASACVDPANYDRAVGEQLCRKHIENRLWELEGYLLQNQAKKKGLTFGEALNAVMGGGVGMRLPKWSPDVVVRAQFPDDNSKMSHAYLYVESRNGRVPWKETYVEMFADDWELVE